MNKILLFLLSRDRCRDCGITIFHINPPIQQCQ